ncbi:hypothetical protein H6F93_33130 [Leptolyngbya sp. FACHB-671]|uniref:Rad52/Rad22 family DNA repair protein n=1 Tax=Leptolyngbya sp. FACHB-671 TaxID=2692812 RepID=UPI001688DDC5|nr:Rad52/Rad22 family DNA repair protein [Leptolyngbya sp. FACHB-671]MBD2072314.1 hypothetical protein [Leptolyngbya sp. FACHB-671]
MNLSEILPQLKAWFPAADHKERDLPGGGRWYYVPWQSIRARLDEVCPDWQVSYGEPIYLDKYCVISCTITICGVSRQAIGNAPIELISSKGKDMSRGTPIERAIADAFKNAAEAFGIAAYLDEQVDDKTKADFVRYMQKHGNGKAVVNYQENQRLERGEPPAPKRVDPPRRPFGQPAPSTKSVITESQRKRLWAIATNNGGYTEAGFKRLIEGCGFASSRSITVDKYSEICLRASDPGTAAIYNQESQAS